MHTGSTTYDDHLIEHLNSSALLSFSIRISQFIATCYMGCTEWKAKFFIMCDNIWWGCRGNLKLITLGSKGWSRNARSKRLSSFSVNSTQLISTEQYWSLIGKVALLAETFPCRVGRIGRFWTFSENNTHIICSGVPCSQFWRHSIQYYCSVEQLLRCDAEADAPCMRGSYSNRQGRCVFSE